MPASPTKPSPRSTLKKPSPKKGEGKGLHKKVGGLPLWGWGVGLVAAIGLGLYLRHRAGGGAAPGAASPTDSGAGSSGGGGGLPSGALPPETIAAPPPFAPPFDFGPPADPGYLPPDYSQAQFGDPYATREPSAPTADPGSLGLHPFMTPASDPNFAQDAARQSALARATGRAAPFGGVTGIQHLKSGATITSYASGRRVEQAPGHHAYVISSGPPSRYAPHPTSSSHPAVQHAVYQHYVPSPYRAPPPPPPPARQPYRPPSGGRAQYAF